MKGISVGVVLRYSRYSSPKKLINRFSSSVSNAFSTDPGGGWRILTFYAEGEEPPKEVNEYNETYVVLEDHLCPNRPVEEAGV
jgi:hypothetical protein